MRRSALEMIDYIVASVAVDMRIGQLVDAPSIGVTAILPLDIFEGE